MADTHAQIQKIAEDLIKIEVNTIVTRSISATKMPNPRHALIDIGKEFYGKLVEFDCLDETLEDENVKKLRGLYEQSQVGGRSAFQCIREIANQKLKALEGEVKQFAEDDPHRDELLSQLAMLQRIKDKSDQLKGLFEQLSTRPNKTLLKDLSLPQTKIDKDELTQAKIDHNEFTRAQINDLQVPLHLIPDDMTLLRKIWEVGVEEIAMQTIIQLDGDVITRINTHYVKRTDLHSFHREGVATAIAFWQDLVHVVKDFFENIVKTVLK